MGKVFISYSHQDEALKERLATQLKVLEIEGFYKTWDDGKIEVGTDWFREIETALNEARVVVMLISAHFLTSDFIIKEEVPRVLKRRREGGVTVVPVIVKACPWEKVEWLSSMQVMPKGGEPVSAMEEHEIDGVLSEVAKKVCVLIARDKKTVDVSGDSISLYRLPVTGEKLFGREGELAFLEKTWTDNHTHIVVLTAWGGVGKTALVNQWLNGMETHNYRGAQKVYAWRTSGFTGILKTCRRKSYPTPYRRWNPCLPPWPTAAKPDCTRRRWMMCIGKGYQEQMNFIVQINLEPLVRTLQRCLIFSMSPGAFRRRG